MCIKCDSILHLKALTLTFCYTMLYLRVQQNLAIHGQFPKMQKSQLTLENQNRSANQKQMMSENFRNSLEFVYNQFSDEG